MTSISASTLTTLAGNTGTANESAGKTYNQFLNLLTTQLQNQDPLDPMDSSEFTNQLVQFSQVEQGILTNQKLDSLLSQNINSQIGQSLAYIGKDAYTKTDLVYFDGTQTDIKVGYAVDGDPTKSKMQILDKDGTVVRTLEMTAHSPSGSVPWDGLDDNGQALEAGNYSIKIAAFDATGVALPTYTAVPGHIEGVETVDGVLYLALTGGNRVAATDAISISDRTTAAPTPSTGTGTDTDTDTTGT